jgi:4-hydroxy-tetrahydrodipicolinate synthase
MLEGAYTAMVTPFSPAGEVDLERLKEFTEWQIERGVDGLVPVGTTGESPTLTVEEHVKVVETVVRQANGRVAVIAGSGANSTSEAIELTKAVRDLGADATLQVTPYYNKPTQEGLYRHFRAVADLGLPVILYNVPGRTSRAIDVETVARLAEHPHVVAVKEAGGSVDRVSQIKNLCEIEVLSGDDALAFPMMIVGATGVISVASNVAPAEVTKMIHLALEGQWTEAAEEHRRLYPLFRDLFIETNPIPVKAALGMMGRVEDVYRLPLCEMSDAKKDVLRATLSNLHLV